MITNLDTLSWSPELVTGNAEFIELSPPGFGLDFGHDFGGGGTGNTIFVVSNVRDTGAGFGENFGVTFGSEFGFEVLRSRPTPPAPGPGSSFDVVASYIFPQPNTTFDPVIAYDDTGTNPVIHIIGTRNTPTGPITSSSQSSDIIKFTFDTVAQTLTGPIVLSSGTRIRSAYDIAVLPNGNQIVVMSLAQPAIQGANPVSFVSIQNGIATLSINSSMVPFVPGQWVLLDNFQNAAFLNGQVVQVISSTASQFSFAFQLPDVGFGISFGNMFGSYAEPENGTPAPYAFPVGDSILALELDVNSAVSQGFGYNFGDSFGDSEVIPMTATIIEASPTRSGNAFDGISLVPNGSDIELYYQSHPKLVTFQDQQFTIKYTTVTSGFGQNFGISFGSNTNWALPATPLYSYYARYADNRLTVLADANGGRYLSETYWSQFNHPEGVLGNVLLGYKPSAGSWTFRPTLGTFAGGSIVQSTLALAQNGSAYVIFLLQPFVAVSNPSAPMTDSYPLHAASLNPATLNLTDVPGFYNSVNFTWLRGTKSIIDNGSVWAVVGERDVLTNVSSESYTLPLVAPFTVQVAFHEKYFQNSGVFYSNGTPLVQVATNPGIGQYTVETSTGLYTFNGGDLGQRIVISYSYVSSIAPVYVSLFNVPPVAAISPQIVTLWRGGSYYAIDISAITHIAVSNSEVTVVCPNDFQVGEQIALYGIGTATFLNGTVLTVTSADPTEFTALIPVGETSLGFGIDFGNNFSNYAAADSGSAALLIPGTLTFSASGSTDADNDALEFFWSENDPDLKDVTISPSAGFASVSVARAAGPQPRDFNVGLAVVDLQPDLVTQRHPALLVSNVAVASGEITVTFAPPGQAGFGSVFGAHFGFAVPSGAIVPVAGDQVMLYGILLNAPLAPTLGQIAGGSLAAQNNLSVIVTYVNNAGETVGSDNSILSVSANHLLTVASPGINGSSTAYNVYVGQPGNETLQTLTPQPLGATFVESTSGFIASFQKPPMGNTALEQALNDEVLDVTSVTATTFTAPFTLAGNFGIDFGNNFNGNYIASLTGLAIKEYQWALAEVTVPQNVAPTISFPAPQWSVGNVLATTLPRNTEITITPDTIPNSTTEFPVVFTGIHDPDDLPTFLWTQTSGTPVVLTNGDAVEALVFQTNGVSIDGETLGFTVKVNDGINPPVTADFTVTIAAYDFGTDKDTLQLSRSVWSQTAVVSNIAVSSGVATITANNSFLVGQPVRLTGLTTATFLNDVVGFYVASASATQFTFNTTFTDYPSTPDTGTAYAVVPLSKRNLSQIWSPMDISVILSDLSSIKRTSVLDGSDRYLVISPHSVLVYAVFPAANPVAVLLRKLLTPNQTTILDAVHTEQDYTLVLDAAGNIFRYGEAPLISTDNPDTTLSLPSITSLSFTDADLDGDAKIMTTQSFANNRTLVLSGEQGATLLLVDTSTLAVQGVLEFLTADNLLYGADSIQFVRWVNVDNLRTGRVLLGSVAYKSAQVTQIAIAGNTLTVTCQNNFSIGDKIVLSGLTNATFLNGTLVKAIAVSSSDFTVSYEYTGAYGPTAEPGNPNNPLAESQTSGTTYETLVDLAQGQIIGTWDKSKLKNQFVQTGEILFDPDTTYSGSPIPPVVLQPTSSVQGTQTYVTLTWQQERPDLITSYNVYSAVETQVPATVPTSAPYTFQIPNLFTFSADEGVIDAASPVAITAIQISSNIVTVTGNNNFLTGQGVKISSLTGLTSLIGQTLTVATASPTQFTANFTNADYGLNATISQVQVSGNILTITTSAPHTFLPGTKVTFSGVGTATFLNGQTVSIVSTASTTFTASFTHANWSPTPDTGTASDADTGNGYVAIGTALVAVPVTATPQANQYSASASGLYTFNVAQSNHSVLISVRQSFNVLRTVGSGATQSIIVPLAAGQTYFFAVEAFGLDGSSGLSNIVSISI